MKKPVGRSFSGFPRIGEVSALRELGSNSIPIEAGMGGGAAFPEEAARPWALVGPAREQELALPLPNPPLLH